MGELNGGSADLSSQAKAGKVNLDLKRSAPIELIESAFGDALDRDSVIYSEPGRPVQREPRASLMSVA